MSFMRTSIAALEALALLLGAESAMAQSKTGTIKIGLNEALSGAYVAVGLPPAAAVRMAVKEINDKGGVIVGATTYKINLIEVDNQSTTASAVSGMTRLVEDDGVKFVFGPTQGTFATQTAQITVPANVMQISAATTWQSSGDLSNPDEPLLFGTQNPVARISQIDALGLKQLGVTKVGFISQDDDVTKSVLPSFTVGVHAAGIEVVPILFPIGTTDYSSYVSRAKGAGVDGIYFLYPQANVNEVLRTVVDLDPGIKAFGGRNLNPMAALKTAIGKPIPMAFFVTGNTPFFDYPSDDKVRDYVKRITAFEPSIVGANATFSFFSYDFVFMLTKAMQQAGSVDDPEKVAKAMEAITYDGVAGKVCFGKTVRTATLDGGILLVRDGKVESTVLPSDCK